MVHIGQKSFLWHVWFVKIKYPKTSGLKWAQHVQALFVRISPCPASRSQILNCTLTNRTVSRTWPDAAFKYSKLFLWISSTRAIPIAPLGWSKSVWPDLAKFHHFGKYLKIFGNIFKVYLVLGKVFNSLCHNLYAFGQILIAVNGKILKTQSGHLVKLV